MGNRFSSPSQAHEAENQQAAQPNNNEKATQTTHENESAYRVPSPARHEFSPSPLPSAAGSAHDEPEDTRNPWARIYHAKGLSNLQYAVHSFLELNSLNKLLRLITREHGEEVALTQSRFALRYLDQKNLETLPLPEKSKMVVDMLHDELNLPGFRTGNAFKQWETEVYGFLYEEMDGLNPDEEADEEQDYGLLKQLTSKVKIFLQQYGFDTMVACLEQQYVDDPAEKDDIAKIFAACIRGKGEERSVSRPDQSTNTIARRVATWLNGHDIQPFSVSPDVIELPNDLRDKLDAELKSRKLSWRALYLLLLTHLRHRGVKMTVEAAFKDQSHIIEMLATEEGRTNQLANARRKQLDAALAAVIADHLVGVEYEQRGVEIPWQLTLAPAADRAIHMLHRTNTNLESQVEINIAAREMLEVSLTEADKKIAELRAELAHARGEVEKATVAVTEAQEQVALEQHWRKEPRYCEICTVKLADEHAEKSHMHVHRQEIDRYRIEHGMPLLPRGFPKERKQRKKKANKTGWDKRRPKQGTQSPESEASEDIADRAASAQPQLSPERLCKTAAQVDLGISGLGQKRKRQQDADLTDTNRDDGAVQPPKKSKTAAAVEMRENSAEAPARNPGKSGLRQNPKKRLLSPIDEDDAAKLPTTKPAKRKKLEIAQAKTRAKKKRG